MRTSKLLRIVALLLSFAMLAAACGGGSDEGSGEPDDAVTVDDGGDDATPDDGSGDDPVDDGSITTDAPDDGDVEAVAGGVLRWGLEADVDGINPTTSALSAPGLQMAQVVFDQLAAIDEDGNWVPYLAESFTPNDDFTSWTMKLREGIVFHDGTPLNSEAVRINFETQAGDALVGLAVKPFYPPIGEGAMTIVDDLTVTYNLLEADARLPQAFTGQLGYVASPTWIAAALEDPTLNQAPVGTGPFIFDSRSQDSVTRFVRNDNWWGGEVYLDAIEFVPVTDPDVRSQLLLEGELHGLATSNVSSIETLASDDSIVNILDDTGEESFLMLNSSAAPFDDIRARQAITFASPRDNYNTLIGLGVNRPADQMFTPESPYYNPDVVQEADMPELAGPLVAEYCGEFPENCTADGKIMMELQWSGPSVVQTRIADLLIEGWGEFFDVTRQELAQDAHIQETAFGLYNAVTWRQFGANDPGKDKVWLMCRNIGGISLNWPKYCDEDRDALILQIEAEADETVRAGMLMDLSQMIHDDYLYVFFNHTLWDIGISDTVKGLCNRVSPEGVALACTSNGRTWFDATFLSE